MTVGGVSDVPEHALMVYGVRVMGGEVIDGGPGEAGKAVIGITMIGTENGDKDAREVGAVAFLHLPLAVDLIRDLMAAVTELSPKPSGFRRPRR